MTNLNQLSSWNRDISRVITCLGSEHDQFAMTHLIQPGIDFQIDLAFRTFGASKLTPREKAVLELMLRGYSPEVSGEKLGIALETVRRHRKNIYHKLDVSFQTDIFSLFINAMSCLAQARGGDPLAVYMSPRQAARDRREAIKGPTPE